MLAVDRVLNSRYNPHRAQPSDEIARERELHCSLDATDDPETIEDEFEGLTIIDEAEFFDRYFD